MLCTKGMKIQGYNKNDNSVKEGKQGGREEGEGNK